MGGKKEKKEKARQLGSSYRSYPVIKTDTHTCGTGYVLPPRQNI
jgi:hypothetical protein